MREALAQGGPALLFVIVDPDALMPPKLELAQVTRFGMTKLREAFDA